MSLISFILFGLGLLLALVVWWQWSKRTQRHEVADQPARHEPAIYPASAAAPSAPLAASASAPTASPTATPSSSPPLPRWLNFDALDHVQQPPETQIKFKSAHTPTAKQFWPDSEDWPFVAINPVITPPEQILYRRLLEALPECMVLAQVQLSRVLGVQDGQPFHVWNNRISRMSLDFVVCRWNGRLVAVIELDDRSHERPDRIEADAKKDAALAAAGVPIIRWKVRAMPDHAQIRHAIRVCGMEI